MNNKEQILLAEKRKYNLPLFLTYKEKEALKQNKPIQHIMGYVEYLDTKIIVNQNVLIPRYETEELVYLTIKQLDKEKEYKILDLCTGSGFIGLALKKHLPKIKLTMSDISYKALKIAKQNSKINFNKLIRNKDIKIVHSNLFKGLKNKKYDVIISNPPYLDKKDETVDISVRNNEPHIALFTGENGWKIYRMILEQYHKHLNKNGLLILEINPYHYDKWQKIPNCEILKDINGKWRFVFIKNGF
ncbi:peptide chain release factor N(5)-glutamine methyltransferase [Mycoplasmopsis iners]|uniref:peptide chain release factor N(5)-glutamine methyltransferase n=1 Tax=Mycoplasmopsis iners TaxID=76630 RepID=UPI00049704A8|nr:peptide chain release factor N(5)-glutamine methyltransferase [Mycoplasmopsis iners]